MLSRERFDQYAERYVASETHAKGSELERMVKISEPQRSWIVLDVATGGGHTALRFAPLVERVVAVDIAAGMLVAARSQLKDKGVGNTVFQMADATGLPFSGGAFDLVTCRIAPHHFQNCPQFVVEAARVLKPGTMLLVQDHVVPEDIGSARYVDEFERLRDPSHNRAFSKTEWESMFRSAGLEVVRTEQVRKDHAFYPWAARQGCTSDVVARLETMVRAAPQTVLDWIEPAAFGTPDAVFTGRHILIAGVKAPGEVWTVRQGVASTQAGSESRHDARGA